MIELMALDQAAFSCALAEAEDSFSEGGIPVGATLACHSQVIASAHNQRVQQGDPIAHGEMACIRKAGRRRDYGGMTLYTTLSPCEMCRGAILLFGIPRVIVGEATTFAGDLEYLRSRGVEVLVLDDLACIGLMKQFQTQHPDIWREDIGQ